MIAALAIFVVVAWIVSTDWMLELAAGASLLALPLAILAGDPAMAGTSMLLLLATIWVMAGRPTHG
jgi:hypothetical protein